jgi:UDPglucose 6-dehydrogenase
MKIGIIGKGYVGNAVKKGFESKGFVVKAYDKFKESDNFEDVAACDFIFICVPTPPKEDGSIDLSMMDEVIGRLTQDNFRGIIVIKSTVIPGTAQGYLNKNPNLIIVSNPEFLTRSTAEYDFLNPDKIIIGFTAGDELAARELAILYKDFGAQIRIIKSEEAEMVKYMINNYYATRVIFANEIYDICQVMNIDYAKVRECFELDKRVAPGHFEVFHGGYRGFGGDCLPKDTDALLTKSEALGFDPELLKTLRRINQRLRGI